MMSKDPADFDRLTRRVKLTGNLTARTGLRVGAGKAGGLDDDAVDLPVLRDADGYPFIPGASLKGVLRSSVEALLPGVEARHSGLWACNPLANGCGDHKGGDRSSVKTSEHCTVCRLFGSHVVSSHLRVSDAMSLDRSGPIPIGRRDGVAIDRDLKSARDKTKYDFQVVPPGTAFELEIFADNVSDAQLGLLLVGLDQLAEGFTALGGFTSRGLGRVDIALTAIRDIDPRQVLSTARLPEPITAGGEVDATLARWRSALIAVTAKEV